MPNISWEEIDKLKHDLIQDLTIIVAIEGRLKSVEMRKRKQINYLDELIINHEKEET